MHRGRAVPGARMTGAGAPVARVEVGRGLVLLALALGVLLVVVSLVWRLAEGAGWQPASQQLDRVLDVDEDLSALNWLSASVFLLSGLLLAQRALGAVGRDRVWWGLLAGGVLFVSLDEAAGAHDPVRVAVETALVGGGLPALLVGVVGLLAVAAGGKVLQVVPRRLRWRALLAVLLVLLAAVGVDSLGPDLANAPERRLETWYVLTSSLEELVELLAACLLLDTARLAAAPGTETGTGTGTGTSSGREHATAEPVEQHEPEPR